MAVQDLGKIVVDPAVAVALGGGRPADPGVDKGAAPGDVLARIVPRL
ncbi:hypothetical protein HFP15_37380 [Amycolatopsis sp. K13G38]|uniref:Uncharacterized protein n=1 Tax=Amycolatopsis acididurans TaxID=2724524 RepID=A0ABX1JI76_9PSEU|nr:hypothetical protein [Amycolatopsis acididurans]NKQ58535.1 hypothetical protein [Amycolatopsis acididurans]